MPDDDIRVSGLGPRPAANLGIGVIAIAFGAWLVAIAVDPAGYVVARWIGGIGGPLFLIEGVLALVTGWRHLHPLTVRDDALRVIDGIRTHTIALTELSGVGLLFMWDSGRGGLPAGWYLTVWDGAGKRHCVVECWLDAHWTTADYKKVTHPQESTQQLAQSEPGRTARRIYDAAWSVQGSGGPLATRQAQKMRDSTVWTRDFNTYAFWSPDGDMGEFAQTDPHPAADDWDD